MVRQNTFHLISIALTLMAGAGLLAGCATDLQPAPRALAAAGLEDAAYSTVNDVRIVAQASEWPGSEPIKQQVTPLRVVIENNSDKPLRVAYNEFTLVTQEGETYSALPLYRIEGTVEEAETVGAYTPITDPGFIYSDFVIAPYLDGFYPGIGTVAGPFYYDPLYYDTNYTYWDKTALPTPAMRVLALPEGVVNSGGRVEGWLYFEEVYDAEEVVFRADLVNSRTGDEFGEVRIPFEVS